MMKKVSLFAVAVIAVVSLAGCSSTSPVPEDTLSVADATYLSILEDSVPELNGSNAEKIQAGTSFCALIVSSGSVKSALTQYGNSIFKATTDKDKAGRALSAISGGAVIAYCPEYAEELTSLIKG